MKITFDFDEKSGVVSVGKSNKGRFVGHPSGVALLKGVVDRATELLKLAEQFEGTCAWRVDPFFGNSDDPDPAYAYRGCNGNHVLSNKRHGIHEGDPCVACGRPIKFLRRSAQ
jgi:hypothetical protein